MAADGESGPVGAVAPPAFDKEEAENVLSASVGLDDGDIGWVPRSGIAKLGYVVQQIMPVGNLVLVGSAGENTFGSSTTK